MKPIDFVRALTVLALSLAALLLATSSAAQSQAASAAVSQPTISYPDLPSETPAIFKPVVDDFDHIRREVMIPTATANDRRSAHRVRQPATAETMKASPRGIKSSWSSGGSSPSNNSLV